MADDTENPGGGDGTFLARIEAMEAARPDSGFALVEVDEYEDPGEELQVLEHYDSRDEAVAALKRMRKIHPNNVFYVYAAPGEEPVLDEGDADDE